MAAPHDLPPPGEGWVNTDAAGELLGVRRQEIQYLIRQGTLPAERRGRSWWLQRVDVEAEVADRARWVTYVEAARLIGCAPSTVTALVQQGRLVQRGVRGTVMPSLERASVEQVAQGWADRRRARDEARRARAEAAAAKRPPEDGHVWVDLPTAALVLGLSANGARWLAEEERIPATRRGRAWWFRRDHLEQAAAARAARARQRLGND